jgi:hypothetical protein
MLCPTPTAAAKCLLHRFLVADVADDQLDVPVQVLGPPLALAMHLRAQAIERANLVTLRQQLISQMRTDETCASRDQYFFHVTNSMIAQAHPKTFAAALGAGPPLQFLFLIAEKNSPHGLARAV